AFEIRSSHRVQKQRIMCYHDRFAIRVSFQQFSSPIVHLILLLIKGIVFDINDDKIYSPGRKKIIMAVVVLRKMSTVVGTSFKMRNTKIFVVQCGMTGSCKLARVLIMVAYSHPVGNTMRQSFLRFLQLVHNLCRIL